MLKYPFLRPFLSLSVLIFLGACASCGGGGGGSGNQDDGGNSSSSGSSSSSTSSSSSSGTPGASGNSPFIVVDQFGYLPNAQKIAVVRDPMQGFDADDSYTPGDTFELVKDDVTDTVVFSGPITEWNGGNADTYSNEDERNHASGDRAWWFDFSSVTADGDYYVRDPATGEISPTFTIDDDVYVEVLRQAMRIFFYQRAGHDKHAPYAEAAWADDASHLQDEEALLYSGTGEGSTPGTEKDLSGGWYDAGDYNKYTNWTADYVIGLLHAYLENPAAWGDDFNIPESGNGTPDIIDEVKWGIDSLIRLQTATGNGSVLSIVDLDHDSPPSDANGVSRYGPANTSATLTTAAAFALGATVFAGLDVNTTGTDDDYATQLQTKAIAAWDWAVANPAVFFQNNNGTNNLGAGQQDVNAAGLVIKKLEASVYLFELTGDTDYRDYFDANYTQTDITDASPFANEFSEYMIHFLLYYANLPAATNSVETDIETKFVSAMNGGTVWGAINTETNPYRAPLLAYTWGSAGVKAGKGNMFYEEILYDLLHSGKTANDVKNVAARYIHYLHGVNPLGKVYLSNMGAYGAENSVDQFYHTWFSHGSTLWDSVSGSTHGPAPGFLVGGPNPSYDRDGCCNSTCGSTTNNNMCLLRPSPPYNQPGQKSYADFNNSWPLNSWSVTENSNGYQIRYLRLLSKFVNN
jgi:endoglucanase